MKRLFFTALLVIGVSCLWELESSARGPGGGGRGGFGGGRAGISGGFGGGGYGGMGFSPSRGGGGYNRMGNLGQGGGLQGGGRPYGNFPSGGGLPGGGNLAGQRPAGGYNAVGPNRNYAAGVRPPNAGQLNNFLDIPRPSAGAGNFNRGNFAGGGAAADFLQTGGGGFGGRASQLPSTGNGPFRMVGEPGIGDAGIGLTPGSRGGGSGAGVRPGAAAGASGAGLRQGAGSGAAAAARPTAGSAATARQNLAQSRPTQIQNRQQWQQNRQQRRDQVLNQVDQRQLGDFWHNHPGWAAWGAARAYNYVTYGAAAAWFGWGSVPAITYNYGDNVYYSGDQVYSGSQPVATEADYAQQASDIVASAPEIPATPTGDAADAAGSPSADEQWLPLGVFALTQDGQASGEQPALFVQLAVNKQGVISGTQKHTLTDRIDTLRGMVDKKSQRAAWGVVDKDFPVIETGLYNLTQDTAPSLIHFADGQTQQWLLVRLKAPQNAAASQ